MFCTCLFSYYILYPYIGEKPLYSGHPSDLSKTSIMAGFTVFECMNTGYNKIIGPFYMNRHKSLFYFNNKWYWSVTGMPMW